MIRAFPVRCTNKKVKSLSSRKVHQDFSLSGLFRLSAKFIHDFILAKQIIETLRDIVQEKKIARIKSVKLEIGSVSLSHDGMPEHADEITPGNLAFGLESLAKGTALEGAAFDVRKVAGDSWKIVDIEGE